MSRVSTCTLGFATGVAMATLVSACGGYFQCDTVHYRLLPGTYADPVGYTLVLDDNGGAVETYTSNQGPVRAEYSVAPAAKVH